MTLSDEAQFQIRRGERMLREREERRRHLREVASRVAAMLRTEFDAQRVWVFGSVVRPWFHEESDLDLAADADTPVDLVFLEEATPLLRERILADGEALV